MAAPPSNNPDITQQEPEAERDDNHRSKAGSTRNPEQDRHRTAAKQGFDIHPNARTKEVLDNIAAYCKDPSLNILVASG